MELHPGDLAKPLPGHGHEFVQHLANFVDAWRIGHAHKSAGWIQGIGWLRPLPFQNVVLQPIVWLDGLAGQHQGLRVLRQGQKALPAHEVLAVFRALLAACGF